MELSKPRFRRSKTTQAPDGFYVTVPLKNGYRLRMDVELWGPGDTYRIPHLKVSKLAISDNYG